MVLSGGEVADDRGEEIGRLLDVRQVRRIELDVARARRRARR